MVYIIGVDHLIQYNNSIVPEAIFHEFRKYLAGLAASLDAGLMAEEFSEESLRLVYGATEDTVKEAARIAGVRHRFCDPEEPDRVRLEIPYFADIKNLVREKYNIHERSLDNYTRASQIRSEASLISKQYWALREEFWFKRILDSLRQKHHFCMRT